MTEQVGRLAGAAAVAFRPVLALGFRLVVGSAGARGESVDLVADHVVIHLWADWFEGELEVELQAPAGSSVALADVVDVSRVGGLQRHRISRSASRRHLESTLRKVAGLLLTQASDVLAGTSEGLERLQRPAGAGGEPEKARRAWRGRSTGGEDLDR